MTASSYILVLDAGTTGPRSFLFDESARIVGISSQEWNYLAEKDVSPLARAFDPGSLWQDYCGLIADSLKDGQVNAHDVRALTVTSQRQGVVFIDKGGHEIYAGPNLDLRAVFEGTAIDQNLGGEVYQTTGHRPSFLFAPAKLRWFQLHRPEAYGRIASVLTLADWLAWRLTGALVSERTLAGEAGLLDIHRRNWCTPMMEEIGLTAKTVPLVESGIVIGTITSETSDETGLATGTPVIASGADTQCGLLGMSVTQEHEVGIVAGWSAPLQMVTYEPVLSPQGRTWAGCFPEREKWVLESSPGDIGNSYQWLGDMLVGDDEEPFNQMARLASAVPPGSEDVLTFLGHQKMDMANVGIRRGGVIFPVPLTFSDVGKGHLVRATLEGAAYAIRSNLEQLEDVAGVPAKSIAVGGGMTHTAAFTRILADVMGRELRLSPVPQTSALGAYLCACVGLGEYSTLEEAASSVKSDLISLEPDPLASAEYQDYYDQWLAFSDGLQTLGT